jgi:hypothetical protein
MKLVLQLWRAFLAIWLKIPGVRFVIRLLGGAEDDDYQVALVEDLLD